MGFFSDPLEFRARCRQAVTALWTSVRYKNWRWHLTTKKTVELYDLSTDISETTNIAAKHPEMVDFEG